MKFVLTWAVWPYRLQGREGWKKALTVANIALSSIFLLVSTYLLYIHDEPGPFSPLEEVIAYKNEHHPHVKITTFPKGYVSAVTFHNIADYLLNKKGGFMSNDVFYPTIILDDIPNWELGVLTQLREFVDVLRRSTSVSASSGKDNYEMSMAHSDFSLDHHAWMMPSAEGAYTNGLQQIKTFLDQLVKKNTKQKFYPRADILDFWLDRVFNRLLTLSQDLIKTNHASQSLSLEAKAFPEDELGSMDWSQWTNIDDVFYRTRGECWALYHFMIAVNEEYKEIIAASGSSSITKQIIDELEYTIMPLRSPVVLSGYKFGMFANHNLSLASYLSRVKVMIVEVRGNLNI
jgi:hypothetical protein